MGWTNSHLHHFLINDRRYGDPWLLEETFEEMDYRNSREATLSKILPRSGKRFPFEYEYDFGDSWWHEVLFEGCLRIDPGHAIPSALKGNEPVRLKTWVEPRVTTGSSSIADPDDDHHERLEWIGGSFDPDDFDSEKATKRMRRGMPDWRKLA